MYVYVLTKHGHGNYRVISLHRTLDGATAAAQHEHYQPLAWRSFLNHEEGCYTVSQDATDSYQIERWEVRD